MAAVAFACATSAAPASAVTPSEKRLLRLIDSTRRSHGLPALRDSPSLCTSARRQSRYMLVHDHFGHLATIRASSRFSLKGEALAMYSGWRRRPRKVLRMWLNSPPHRALVLSPRYRFAGVGAKRGNYGGSRMTTWTMHLGRR
jgi:uncharacterized protein YkwD